MTGTQNDCLGNKDNCKMRCCKRIHLQIHNGNLMDYFDFLNMHKNIRVIQKNKINFLEIKSKCDNLNDDGTCNIWDTRPEICRDPYTIGTKIIYFPECIYKQEENEEFDLWDD